MVWGSCGVTYEAQIICGTCQAVSPAWFDVDKQSCFVHVLLGCANFKCQHKTWMALQQCSAGCHYKFVNM
eukprot:1159950-Pelagomonas_calceolata.AAC.1